MCPAPQVYPGGLSDEVLQVLGSASRAATPDDVRKWNVTKIDTLSSLMNQRNGDWDAEMVLCVCVCVVLLMLFTCMH